MTNSIAINNMCLQCKFWAWNANYSPKKENSRIDPPDKLLECKRHAPVLVNNGKVLWPITGWGDYCGDFEIDKRFYK